MSFEELLYSQLKTDSIIAQTLATFSGGPAIFEIQAPDDTDKGWINKKQYPRIVYAVDKQEDPERKVSGKLVIDIATDGAIETIEERVRSILSNVFFEPTNEPVMALVWNNTAAFEETDNVIGVTMTFDLFAFPSQMTQAPDPIAGLNTRTATVWPTAYLFDQSQGNVWAPTGSRPAIYWRITSLGVESRTNAVTWISVTIQGHIFAPQPTDRMKILRTITENLAIDERVMLSDGAPLYVQNISADSSRDPLRSGQITISGRYGILRTRPDSPPINNIITQGGV